jgi:hypothetical protein
MSLWSVLIGRRLANEESASRKINVAEGVSAIGLDGLSSSAYGPEATLTILIPVGVAGLHVITPIMGAILVLLALLFVSYWQTIEAYPSNGGAGLLLVAFGGITDRWIATASGAISIP